MLSFACTKAWHTRIDLHSLSQVTLFISLEPLGFGQVCNHSAKATLLLPHDHTATLLSHLVIILGCVFATIKFDLVAHIAGSLRQMLQEWDNLVKTSIIHVAVELWKYNYIVLVEWCRIF